MKVLILGVAPVQLDAVLELNRMGCDTYTIAMAKDGPAGDAANHFDIINFLDERAVIRHIIDNKIDVVYSTGSDLAIPIACRVSEELGMPHFITSEVAYICNHKDVMRSVLTEKGRGNIPYQVYEKPSELNMDCPCILKPSDSQGQRGIFIINSKEEFNEHFEEAKSFSRDGKVIVEKYIDGPEVSVNGYMVNGVLSFMVISDRCTWPMYTGLVHKHIVPGITVNKETQDEIKSIVQDACKRIGILNGPVYLQMKIMGKKPYIIEIAPRLDGCHMWNILQKATGVNLIRLTFNHLLYNDVSELDYLIDTFHPMELAFWCQEPNTIINYNSFVCPNDVIYHYYYYGDGDKVRSVNGHFDKVGYYIRNL